jgi:hypothetical protein
MFKKLRWPFLVLIAPLTVLAPASVMAEINREHPDHALVQVDNGHGFWHDHCGWRDRWGRWHRRPCWE